MHETSVIPGALGERGFRLFFTGYAVALTGSAMVPVALTFAILERGGSAGDVGLVLAAESAALVALTLLGGVLADRVPRRALMVGSDLARCAAQIIMALLLLRGPVPIPVAMALAAVLGGGMAFFGPAQTGLLPGLVSAPRLQDANALLGIARFAGQIAGPAIAGLLVAAGGSPWAIVGDAASYAVSALCLMRLDVTEQAEAGERRSMLAELRLGWSEFTAHRWLWIIVVQFGFFHMLVLAPLMVLGAVVAERSLGGGGAWGAILTAQGLGAVAGGLAIMRLRPTRPLLWATVATFTGVPLPLLLAGPAPLPVLMAAALFSGTGIAVFATLFDTTLQREIPPAMLSRVSSYDYLGSFALLPIGYALAGPLASLLSTGGTLLLSAAWLAATSAFVLSLPAVHGLRARPS